MKMAGRYIRYPKLSVHSLILCEPTQGKAKEIDGI